MAVTSWLVRKLRERIGSLMPLALIEAVSVCGCKGCLPCMCMRERVCVNASVGITNLFCCLDLVCKQSQNVQVSKADS